MAVRGRVRIGHVRGIPIGISPSWFIVLALIAGTLAVRVLPELFPDYAGYVYWLLGLAAAALFFASIVAHELAHSLVARRFGVPVKGITLFVFGGVSQISQDASRPRTELLIAIVGPLTSLALAAACFGLWAATGFSEASLGAMLPELLFVMNLALGAFNLAPGFPMDGGRIAHAAIWSLTGDFVSATRWATFAGRGFAYAMIGLGVTAFLQPDFFSLPVDQLGGLWLVLIGLFLDASARANYAQVRLLEDLRLHLVDEAMSHEIATIPSGLSIDTIVNVYMIGEGKACLFVTDPAGAVVGIVTPREVRAIPRARWAEAKATDAMVDARSVQVTTPKTDIATALLAMDGEDLFQMPVVEQGRLIGILDRVHVLQMVQRIRAQRA